jgi:hypothetical protein
LREVIIPDDAKVASGEDKHKANKVIIGKRWDLRKVETWEYLTSIGANIHALDYVLSWAVVNGHLEIVKYLHENDAYTHAYNDLALILAAKYGHLEIVKYLVENGADIHVMNDEALISAAENGHLDVVKYLHKNGANIHVMNDEALRVAIMNKHTKVVNYLERKTK